MQEFTKIIKPPKKVLIINIFGIGDVLFTTPIINNIKFSFPKAEIGYLCNRRTESVLRKNKKISIVHVYERDEFKAVSKKSFIKYLNSICKFIFEIKRERYDLVIDVSMNSFTSFLAWFCGARERIVINYKNRSFPLNTKINIKGYEDKHVIEYYLDLLRGLGLTISSKEIDITLDEEDIAWVNNFWKDNLLNVKKTVIGIVPGGGASWGNDAKYKRWPIEKYAKLADKLIENFSAEIILMGDKNEIDLCSKIADLMKYKPNVACGQTTISQFAALAQRCYFCVLNDGGPLHIAVAAGAKTVSIFGPVDEKVYGPYPPKGHLVVTKNIACRPCYHRFKRANCDHVSCLNSLTVDEVLERIKKS